MDLSSAERRDLRSRATRLKPAMNIGKAGLSDAVVDEIGRRLRADRLVKVRLLPSARHDDDRRELASTLAGRTGSILVEVRGGTVLLYRPRRGR